MKIAGTGSIHASPIRRKSRTGRTGATGFATTLDSETPVRGVHAPTDVASVNALLSVQEVVDPLEERRRALRRGKDLLDRLDEIRHGLLVGAIPRDKLDRLLAMVRRQHDLVADPRLRNVLQEIELRASVELAKLGRLG